ncbi:MAG: nucleotidyltransferase family protein [Anaerolineae bacterium]|nr:nucleotidyltransferase family protein [Anaerolineae bacterium]
MNPSEAVILVGGKGTRLRGVVSDRPKPMAEVGRRPFLEWIVLALRSQGVCRVVFCTGYMSEVIERHFTDGRSLGVDIAYSRDPTPLGTGGALRNALSLIHSEVFLALNGDSYCRLDVDCLARTHRARRARATLWLVPVEDCGRYGSVDIDEGGAVLAFREKSSACGPGLISAGVYLLHADAISDLQPGRMISIEKDVFPRLVGRGLYAVLGTGPFIDIGTPEAYRKAEEVLSEEFWAIEKPAAQRAQYAGHVA